MIRLLFVTLALFFSQMALSEIKEEIKDLKVKVEIKTDLKEEKNFTSLTKMMISEVLTQTLQNTEGSVVK